MSISIKTQAKDTLPKNVRLNINVKTMEIDNEEKDDANRVHELKEALETVDEENTHVTSVNAVEALCDKLLNFTSAKVSVSKIGI